MNPLLVNGDGLHIVPYRTGPSGQEMWSFLFRPGARKRLFTALSPLHVQGIKTRGDNANVGRSMDSTPDNILGRVTYIQRKGRRRTIFGGFRGRITAHSFRCSTPFRRRRVLLAPPCLPRTIPINPSKENAARSAEAESALLSPHRRHGTALGRWALAYRQTSSWKKSLGNSAAFSTFCERGITAEADFT